MAGMLTSRTPLTVALAATAAGIVLAGCAPAEPREPWPIASSRDQGSASPSATPSPKPEPFVRPAGATYVPETQASTQDDGTAGSGCTPGMSSGLPDGVWRGVVESATVEEIELDLICSWAHESDTFKERIGDLDTGDGPVIYVTQNDNPMTRDLPLADGVAVWPSGHDGDSLTGADFVAQLLGGGWDQVWVFVNDGQVTEISEVHDPGSASSD